MKRIFNKLRMPVSRLILVICFMSFSLFSFAQNAEYEVKVETSVWDISGGNYNGQCANDFTMTAYFTDNSSTELVHKATCPGTYTHVSTIPASKKFSSIHVQSSRNWHRLIGGCNGYDGGSRDITDLPSNGGCFVRNYTQADDKMENWGSTIKISVLPKNLSIQTSNTLLPSKHSVTISATAGFPSQIYGWEYQTDSNVWIPFPSNVFGLGTATVIFSGNTLVGSEDFAELVRRKGNLRVRLNYGCGYSNIITLSPRLSAPTPIIPSTYVMPTCYKGNDGSFTFNFDRKLFPGETLDIGVRGYLDTTHVKNDSVIIGDDLKYTMTGLPADYYKFVLVGKFPDASYATYTQPSYTDIAYIQERPKVKIDSLMKTRNVSCFGGSDGSLTINVSGGANRYIAEWRDGNGAWNASPSFSESFQVRDSTWEDVPYEVDPSGSAWVYFYREEYRGIYSISDLPAGTYQIRVKDTSGCYAINETTMDPIVQTLTIGQPADSVSIQIMDIQNLTGYKTGNGEIQFTSSGGTSGYTYSWSKAGQALPDTTASVSGLAAGTYFVQVKDANYALASPAVPANTRGCSDTITIPLTQPDSLVALLAEKKPISCNGDSDGSLVVRASGGVKGSGYQYVWEKQEDGVWIEVQSSLDSLLINQAAGNFRVRVSDTKSNTALSSEFSLQEPAVLNIPSFNQQQPLCHGNTNGWAEPNVVGGTQPYSYLWREPGTPTTSRLDSLSVGNYTVAVTDARGCQTDSTAQIDEPDELVATPTVTLPGAYNTSDGSIGLQVVGGTLPYSYAWDGGSVSNPLTGLPARTQPYRSIITDAHGCSDSVQARIIYPLSVQLQLANSISCFGRADAQLRVIATGGVGLNYHYNWYKMDGGTPVEQSAANATDSILSHMDVGTYKVKATDEEGNEAWSTEVFISQPDVLQATATVNLPTTYNAADGSIGLQVVGGTLPYSYAWDYGSATSNPLTNLATQDDPFHVTVTDHRGCTISLAPRLIYPINVSIALLDSIVCAGRTNGRLAAQATGGVGTAYQYRWYRLEGTVPELLPDTSRMLENIAAGTYRVTVSDREMNTADTVFVLGAPDSLKVSSTITLPTSLHGTDGIVALHPTGGIAPYSYLWAHNGANTSILTDLIARDEPYTVTIRDSKGCEQSLAPRLIYPMAADITMLDSISCTGRTEGRLSVQVTGGVGTDYKLQWYQLKNGVLQQLADTSSVLGAIGAGTYKVVASDREMNTVGSEFILSEPDSLKTSFVINLASSRHASDGAIELIPTGGTAPYSFLWDYDGSSQNSLVNIPERDEPYSVLVTDSKGCQQTVLPSLVYPIKLSVVLVDSISCAGRTDGRLAATALARAGTIFKYQWYKLNSGVPQLLPLSDTTTVLPNVGAGTYRVKASDAESHSVEVDLVVNAPDTLKVPFTINYTTTPKAADGVVTLQPTGGTQPYTYLWDYDGSSNARLGNLPARDEPYSVAVTDHRGCEQRVAPSLSYPIKVELSLIDSITCAGRTDGRLLAQLTKGVGAAYQWYKIEDGVPHQLSVPDTTTILSNLGAGSYMLRATDRDLHAMEVSMDVYEPDTLKVNFTQRNLKCKHDSDAWAEVHPIGGIAPYTYSWSTGVATQRAGNLTEDTYNVRVTDSRNCIVEAATTILAPEELQIVMSHRPPQGFNYTDASVWVKATGGTGAYNYAWSDRVETTDSLQSVGHGTYTVKVTDVNGCSKRSSDTIPNPALLEAFVAMNHLVSCYNGKDGELTASATGGVGTYRYNWYRVANGAQERLSSDSILKALSVGTYQVQVMDENGITAFSDMYTFSQPELLKANVTANSIACNGGRDGWVEVAPTGGVAPYSYQWTTGDHTARVEHLTDNKYWVLVTDSNGCEAKAQAEITVPGGLVVENIGQDPVCFNDNNGFIQLMVNGGAAPYSYKWDNGDSSPLRNNLTAGDYKVVVTDANGCFRDISYTLNNPSEIKVDLGPDKTLCKGHQLLLDVDLNDPLTQYRWYKDNNLYSSEPAVQLSEAALYRVDITNGKGCKGSGSIRVNQSKDDIAANFAMATKAPQGELVQLVNASFPAPEQVDWLIPDSPNVKLLASDDTHAELVFTKNGIYTLGIRSRQGACEQSTYKNIEIVDKLDLPEYETPKEPFLKQFLLYPNPSNGQFTVKVELGEKADIRLRLVSLSGTVVDERRATGSDNYELQYQLSNVIGVHVLQLISPKANSSIKIVLY